MKEAEWEGRLLAPVSLRLVVQCHNSRLLMKKNNLYGARILVSNLTC